MTYPPLTPAKEKAMRNRFGDVIDVDRELRAARDYAENIHAGRPYSNFGRFCWNWLRTASERRLAQMPRKQREAIERRRSSGEQSASARESEFPPLSREQLEAIANDESEPADIRELARAELESVR
jgi:hypothetical protein